MRQSSACPSLIVHSTAVAFGTGSAPGKARHTGHVRVFGPPPNPASHPQNIFVRVFSCTWISRPMTGSHSATEELLRPQQRHLDVSAHLEDREVLRQCAVHADEAQLALAGLERKAHVADLHGARAVEHAGALAEDALDREHEVGGSIDDGPHLSLSGTGSKAMARSSAWPVRKSVFSENCGPISCRPTRRPSERPHGIDRLGSPAMFGGIVSTSARYIASGLPDFSPILNATVGEVGLTSTSNRSNADSNSRAITVLTFCA